MPHFLTTIGAGCAPVTVDYTVDGDGDTEIVSVIGDEKFDVSKYLSEDDFKDLEFQASKHYPKWADEEAGEAAISRYESNFEGAYA